MPREIGKEIEIEKVAKANGGESGKSYWQTKRQHNIILIEKETKDGEIVNGRKAICSTV